MLCWQTVLVGSRYALLLVVVVAEPLHKYRDLDEKITFNENHVTERTDAELMLTKCGYLRCSSGLTDIAQRDGGICNEIEIQSAISNFQRTFGLPETGEFDKETITLMSIARCENKESEKVIVNSDNKGPNGLQEELLLSLIRTPVQTHISLDSSIDNENQHVSGQDHTLRKSSDLYEVLTRKPHHRHPTDYVKRIHLEAPGNKTSHRPFTPEANSKRSTSVNMNDTNSSWNSTDHGTNSSWNSTDRGIRFNKTIIRWRLLVPDYRPRIPPDIIRLTIGQAFRIWSEVIPLRFIEDRTSDINAVDVKIAFRKGSHLDCDIAFDGPGGHIAHSWKAGDMHFDEEESFHKEPLQGSGGIQLLAMAVHEIGHVLGLNHNNDSTSIMYPHLTDEFNTRPEEEFDFSPNDKRNVQNIYGVCTGSFDTVFDQAYKISDRIYFHQTRFFRNNHYWTYNYGMNKPGLRSPFYIVRDFRDVPDNVDAFVNIWRINEGKFDETQYFFKGEHYYKFDSDNDSVVLGYPKRIRRDFGPKPNSTERIPDNIDSVYFDLRDSNMYFFKNDDVYVYNPYASRREKGCCVRKRKIVEEFPTAPGNISLIADVDAVYYSWTERMVYFFKGDVYWRNTLFKHNSTRISNSLQYMGPWNRKWLDLCDANFLPEGTQSVG